MITLFTHTKAFVNHIAVIQRNALRSWKLLHPQAEIILFGGRPGTAEMAGDLGARHVPAPACNELGTPLVSSLFTQANLLAQNSWLVYVNADIILMGDFIRALQQLLTLTDRFLMIGQRFNVSVNDSLCFDASWEERLSEQVLQNGFRVPLGIDYFVFPRNFWGKVPDLTIGRANWDNWPLYTARLRGAPVIDVTQVVTAVHQDHDYSHHPGGKNDVYLGIEARRNLELLGGPGNRLTPRDATHSLTWQGLKVRCRSCFPACSCKQIRPFWNGASRDTLGKDEGGVSD